METTKPKRPIKGVARDRVGAQDYRVEELARMLDNMSNQSTAYALPSGARPNIDPPQAPDRFRLAVQPANGDQMPFLIAAKEGFARAVKTVCSRAPILPKLADETESLRFALRQERLKLLQRQSLESSDHSREIGVARRSKLKLRRPVSEKRTV